MEILIDSNVVLDRILKREPFHTAADRLFEIFAENLHGVEGYISASSVTDIQYIAYRNLKDHSEVRQLLSEALKVIKILPVNGENIQNTFNLDWKDFEDAVQYSVALSNKMDAIVTRNMKGFSQAQIKICTP